MSTLSGNASKGEKGKSKFQSLDINSLYRGESLEPHQSKPTLPRKHGMQILGKVLSARRAPANLPSLKSEHSGNDPAISLVPSGGTGWGSKPGETAPAQAQTQQQPATSGATTPAATTPQPPPQASLATATQSQPIQPQQQPPPPTPPPPPPPQQPPQLGVVVSAGVVLDKSWSSMLAGPGEGGTHPPSFLAHQSPQFQHEFPKLSSGDGQAPGVGVKGGSDTIPQYGPGPSLRPQTEGSWIQGGGRNAAGNIPGPAPAPLAHTPPGGDPAGGRNNLVQCVPPGVGMVPGGPGPTAPQLAHQYRGLIPPFMYRGSFPGGFPPNFQAAMHGPRPPRFPYPPDNSRFVQPPRPIEEEGVPRPIIKEEELSKMDDISHDAGWATHDDIDYNQKLAFSDDEATQDEDLHKNPRVNKDDKRERKRDSESSERERIHPNGPHVGEDDEIWRERQRQQSENMANVVERAKQRKEEEEKRFESRERAKQRKEEEEKKFEESRQKAAEKLQKLEQKMGWDSKAKEDVEAAAPVPIPLPDWEKGREQKEKDRSRTSSEGREDKLPRETTDFRQHTQVGDRMGFVRETPRNDRDQELQRNDRERELPRNDRERELPRNDREREIPRNERERDTPRVDRERDNTRNDRERDIPRNDRERDIPRNDRERDIPRNDRERETPRNDREREAPHNDREREAPRIEREREIPRSEREIPRNEREREIPRSEREIPRNEREREITRSEREIPRNEREREIPRSEREIPRNEREREIPRSEREIPRNEREREIPRSEREIPRNEREREIPRSEREIPRNEREREIPRSEREIPRNEREREIPHNEREVPRNEREREIPRTEREREIPRTEREREIPRTEREREIPRTEREREIPRTEREREIPRTEREREIPRTERERNLPRADRDRDGSRSEIEHELSRSDRDRDNARNEREREIPRNDRDRDLRVERERERERDIRAERDVVFSRQFQNNLPPRFQKQQAERHQFMRVGSGGSSSAPQPLTSSLQQALEPRWGSSSSHFPGPIPSSGGAIVGPKLNQQVSSRRGHGEGETSSLERERVKERDVPEERRDRRDRQTPELQERDRYRQGGRDHRGVYDTSSNRKTSNSYYEGSTDFGRNYARDFDYDREKSRVDRDSDQDHRDKRHPRDVWDSRHYDERRDSDTRKDTYDRHVKEEGEWRDLKDWKFHEEQGREWNREKEPERRDRDERPQRPDSRDSRASRESRTSRDSLRDDKNIHDNTKNLAPTREFSSSWADTLVDSPPFTELKEEKPKKPEYFRDDRERRDIVRHTPGPITREKLEAAELRGDTKRSLTQLKRSSSGLGSSDKKISDIKVDKQERKQSETMDVWNRSSQKLSEHIDTGSNRTVETISKSWTESHPSDCVVQLPQLTIPVSEKQVEEATQEEKLESNERLKSDLKDTEFATQHTGEGIKKVDDRELNDSEMDKRDKGNRMRGGHGQSDPAQRGGGRHNIWNGYAVYRGGWGPQRELRGRRGGHRVPRGGRLPSSAHDWNQGSESELSGDEVSGSTESGKEDMGRQRRPDREKRPPRSPKQGNKKMEKDDRNREVRHSEGEKTLPSSSDPRRYEKRTGGYENTRGGREGFAPRGEPSRRGRGGFRPRGSVGRRMDGYGPPSSKSPFGQPSDDSKVLVSEVKDTKENQNLDSGETLKNELGGEMMSIDDRTKLKQQQLAAGIIGSGARHTSKISPPQMPPRMQRKSESERRDSSRSKGGRGSRGSHSQGRDRASSRVGGSGIPMKQNSSDVGDECWETTSENSELDDRDRKQEMINGRRVYPRRDSQGSARRSGPPGGLGNNASRSVRGQGPSPGSSRAPGAEKRANGSSYGSVGVRNTSQSGSAQPMNNRGLNSRGGNQSPGLSGGKMTLKETSSSVNRVDEIKLNDPSLVSQALTDLSAAKKSARVDKTNALEGIDLNNYASVVIVDDQPEVTLEEERFNFDADNGFQEVRSKKNVKESRQKSFEEQKSSSLPSNGREKDRDRERKGSSKVIGASQLVPTSSGGSMSSIPGAMLGGPSKPPFERPRQSKLPPRLARARETNRLQKAQQQQHQHGMHNDVSEMNKINQSISLFPDPSLPAPPPSVNAWDKPITSSLRPNSPSSNTAGGLQLGTTLTSSTDSCVMEMNDQPHSGASSQRSTPSGEKTKLGREVVEKTVLDGTSPPVQTIIFENTNYKTGPSDLAMKAKIANHLKNQRIDKSRDRKLTEDVEDMALGFTNKTPVNLSELGKGPDNKSDPIQMPLNFNKNEDSADMKLDFTFDADLSQLTEDKNNKVMGLPRSMHMTTGVQSTISPSTADLNFKIASVKKVWESMPVSMPTVIEQHEDGSVTSTASSFTPTFGNAVDAGMDPSAFGKGVDGPGDDGSSLNSEVVYTPGPAMQGVPNSYSGGVCVKTDSTSTSSNVCKLIPPQVKPQPVMSSGPSPIGHPGAGALSPPPFNSSTTQQTGHINYQPTLGGTAAQFGGISAIPSPPTVLYNSSQSMQGGLYGAYQIDGSQVSQVLGGQARSQFSQFPAYGLSQGLSQTSAFNQQSMYLQTAPHPPPNAVHDMNMSQFRIQASQNPFGQNQTMGNNPNTVLISSSSNSLMSASVKPSSQQIGAIGTKGASPYQQQSALQSAPQPSQLYIQYDPSQVLNVNQSYLSSSQMVQRPGPVQSNVVPTIPPSSSFYSGSSGGQTGFYQPTNSSLQAVQQQAPSAQQLHQTGSHYGLPAYGTQSGTGTPVGLQGFSSQFLSSPLQMAQQYRNTGHPGPTFLKSGVQHQSDHGSSSNGRAQLKSPSSSQPDVLSSVFSAPQIPSPKSRNCKQQQPQQQSPTQQQQQQQQHHKFNPYQGVNQSAQAQMAFQQNVRGSMNLGVRGNLPSTPPRYPSPIQRPVVYQQGGASSGSGAMMSGNRHRSSHPTPTRPVGMNKMQGQGGQHYYGSNLKMDTSSDGKNEVIENKLSDGSPNVGNAGGTSSANKPLPVSNSQQQNSEVNKEESSTPNVE